MVASRQRLFLALFSVITGGAVLESEAQPWSGGKGCMVGGSGSEFCRFVFTGGEGLGCSVTCQVGYYACCAPTGCVCVKEAKARK